MGLGGKRSVNSLGGGRSFEDHIAAGLENRRKNLPQVLMVIDN